MERCQSFGGRASFRFAAIGALVVRRHSWPALDAKSERVRAVGLGLTRHTKMNTVWVIRWLVRNPESNTFSVSDLQSGSNKESTITRISRYPVRSLRHHYAPFCRWTDLRITPSHNAMNVSWINASVIKHAFGDRLQRGLTLAATLLS